MRSNPYCAIAIFTVLTLCGMASSFAQSPESRARTLDLRASVNTVDLSGASGFTGRNTIKSTTTFEQGGPLIFVDNVSHLLLDGGHNNIFQCDVGSGIPPCQPTSDAYGIIIAGTGASPTALGDIDHNFFGLDGSSNPIDPANEATLGAHFWNDDIHTQSSADNITFTSPSNTESSVQDKNATECGSFAAVSHPKMNSHALSLRSSDSVSNCDSSYQRGVKYFRAAQWKLMYDTLCAFVQRCPTNPNAPAAIGNLSTAVQAGGNGPFPGCYPSFKKWLLSAFAWNPHNSQYFCAIVDVLSGSLTENNDTGYQALNTATNKGLSVFYWIIHNPLCTTHSDSQSYTNGRGSQREDWWSTQDTTKVKLDTTIYSLHDLGLDSVLKYASMLGVHNSSGPGIITNASANPNPLNEGTVISFGLKQEAYVKIEIYDLLGNVVASNGFESVLEPKNYSIPISLHGLPSGTYFARILSTYGEAQTVKLVKE